MATCSSKIEAFQLVCPSCRGKLSSGLAQCAGCGRGFARQEAGGWLDLTATEDVTNLSTEAAYKIYSKYYAPFALLAYWIVWRGVFRKHVAFFKGMLKKGQSIVDLATGDGSLTQLALFRFGTRAKNVMAVDISSSMLLKARKKLPSENTLLVRGDVMQLPFADSTVPLMSCFGGLNSFPSGGKALREMARVLAPGGTVRGSVLLLPETPWRRKLVRGWIKKGYQTEEVTPEIFSDWTRQSGLQVTCSNRVGDVILFELQK